MTSGAELPTPPSIEVGRFLVPVPGQHGPWEIRSTREVWSNHFLRVAVDQVTRPDGLPGQHVVVAIKPGVCVLALDHAGQLRLTREFHYAVGRETIEGVSGGIDPQESPLECAQRELAEELGWAAGSWELLTTIDPFTSVLVSPTRVYLAKELQRVERRLEGTERIEECAMHLDEAVAAVRNGVISHAPTCVGILLVAERMNSGSAGRS